MKGNYSLFGSSRNKGYDKNKFSKIGSLSKLISNPKNLGKFSTKEIYAWLKDSGYKVLPLSRGSLKNISYNDGGGFKVNYGGDGLFQYHPQGSHHGDAYYKISDGKNGTHRYNLKGKEIK